MKKKKKSRSDGGRRRSSGTALKGQLEKMQALALVVAYKAGKVLAYLPHGFSSLAEGQGKKPLDNKRVLLVALLLVWVITRPDLKTRLWSIPLLALLVAAVGQHRATYESDSEETLEYLETYEN